MKRRAGEDPAMDPTIAEGGGARDGGVMTQLHTLLDSSSPEVLKQVVLQMAHVDENIAAVVVDLLEHLQGGDKEEEEEYVDAGVYCEAFQAVLVEQKQADFKGFEEAFKELLARLRSEVLIKESVSTRNALVVLKTLTDSALAEFSGLGSARPSLVEQSLERLDDVWAELLTGMLCTNAVPPEEIRMIANLFNDYRNGEEHPFPTGQNLLRSWLAMHQTPDSDP